MLGLSLQLLAWGFSSLSLIAVGMCLLLVISQCKKQFFSGIQVRTTVCYFHYMYAAGAKGAGGALCLSWIVLLYCRGSSFVFLLLLA